MTQTLTEQQLRRRPEDFKPSTTFHHHTHVLQALGRGEMAHLSIGQYGLQADIWVKYGVPDECGLRLYNREAYARGIYPFKLPVQMRGETHTTNSQGYISFPKAQLLECIKALQPLGHHPDVIAVSRPCHAHSEGWSR